ncbi:hypothetical protein ACVWZR_000885 [Bradyrhizobium sp. i1.3.1]
MVSMHLLRNAWTDHLREAIDIGCIHIEGVLDLPAHRIGPGLGAEDADLERALARVELLALELVEDRQHVARRHRDDVGSEVVDELHLPLGHAAGDRHHGATKFFRAVVHTQSAGKQAVAIGVVDDHAGAAAGGADRACHHLRPGVDVALRIAHHDRLSRGAGGGMHAHQLFARHGEHVEGIIVAQIRLHGEREFCEIGEFAKVGRMHAGLVEGLAVMRDVVVGVLQRPGQPLRLQRHDLVTRRALMRVHLGAIGVATFLEPRQSHPRFPTLVGSFYWSLTVLASAATCRE